MVLPLLIVLVMNANDNGQVFEIRSLAHTLPTAGEIASARAAVTAAKREAIRTLAVLEFRSCMNGRK